jgi:hypothetical protein
MYMHIFLATQINMIFFKYIYMSIIIQFNREEDQKEGEEPGFDVYIYMHIYVLHR